MENKQKLDLEYKMSANNKKYYLETDARLHIGISMNNYIAIYQAYILDRHQN